MENLVEIRGLFKAFGEHKVLNGIDLDVKEGSSLVILGGSGTGKSVLIKNIIGLIKPDAGSIKIGGVETVDISRQGRLEILKECGFLFQGGALFDSLTVEDNITFFAERLYALSQDEKHDLAEQKLSQVGLDAKFLKSYPSELSGGMQKRVSLARAICTNPKILFFDEPTTGLDPIMSNVINELIVKARQDLGATTITITHDMASAKYIGEQVAFLYDGILLWQGGIGEIETSGNEYLDQFINGLTTGPISV